MRVVSRRKNFLPTLVLTIIFWGALGWLFYSFPPTNNLLFLAFYFLVFGTVFLTTALASANSKVGFFCAAFVVSVLLFRYHQIGNLLNLALLGGIFLALGFYFR